jgi:hypothetical protein
MVLVVSLARSPYVIMDNLNCNTKLTTVITSRDTSILTLQESKQLSKKWKQKISETEQLVFLEETGFTYSAKQKTRMGTEAF